MSEKIGFAFDLHGTLALSNDAWVEAFILVAKKEDIRECVTNMVYQKVSRKKIAEKYNICFEDVLDKYHEMVEPDIGMCILARQLAVHYPVFLVSSANHKKVSKDVAKLKMQDVFTNIYDSDNFHKSEEKDWENLILSSGIDMIYYIGNDVTEDYCGSKKVTLLLSGGFLNKLNDLGILYRRGEVNE